MFSQSMSCRPVTTIGTDEWLYTKTIWPSPPKLISVPVSIVSFEGATKMATRLLAHPYASMPTITRAATRSVFTPPASRACEAPTQRARRLRAKTTLGIRAPLRVRADCVRLEENAGPGPSGRQHDVEH